MRQDINLSAARGEYESFQIAIRADSGTGLTNVRVSVSDLTSAGQVIPAKNLTLFREHFVYVQSSSPDWQGSNRPLGPGWYPDGLIPFVDPQTGLPPATGTLRAVPFQVAAGTNQAVWVDVFVPRDAVPGDYSGTYTVTSDQGATTGRIYLKVYNFTLPLEPSLRSSFSFWTAGTLEAQQELLRNKLAPLSVNNATSQSVLKREYGLGQTHLGYFSGADVSRCAMSAPPSVTDLKNAVSAQTPGLMLFNFTADEVDHCTNLYSVLKEWGYNLHQAGVQNLVTMKPVPQLYDDGSGTGRSAVDIWTLLPVMYDGAVSSVKYVQSKGDAVWSANTLVQDAHSPKWLIDFRPMDFRIQPGFMNQSLGMSGLLYWRIDRWAADAWNQVNNAGVFSAANYPGEGILVYPGETVGIKGVAPSIRLKWLRDGVEDYEYIALLKKAGKGAWALQMSQTVAADFAIWTRNPDVLESARAQLATALEVPYTLPTAPLNPTPSDGSTGLPVSLYLGWSGASSASFDVYFGTTANPPLVATVNTTSLTRSGLVNGTKYYWRVVARNANGTASSAVWSFTTIAPPPPPPPPPPAPTGSSSSAGTLSGAVTPSSGTGLVQSFTFKLNNPKGFGSIAAFNVRFSTGDNGANACWMYMQPSSRSIYLASDSTSAWTSATIGSSTVLTNSQCSVKAAEVVLSGSGTTLTVTLPMRFKTRFAGVRETYVRLQDASGTATPYLKVGTWTVPRQ